jgi:hypothetical protein
MEIPPEVVAAKNVLEEPLLAAGLITGIDFGVRDEEHPDPEDLALRVFVGDAGNVPPEVHAALVGFPFTVIVLQRVFMLTQLPDTVRHRPLVGGVSVASSRFLASGTVPVGTLGAIVTDSFDPSVRYGLSNHHVLCGDMGRQVGDPIVQPEPSLLGILQGDAAGRLHAWSFPETTADGVVDAAIFTLDPGLESRPEIVELGPVSGTVAARHGMLVSKRGRTTGRTFGWISGVSGSYSLDFPRLPPVGNPRSTARTLKEQIQVHVDFPQSIVFGESGDSGSVVVGEENRVVGLYWASGTDALGNPLRFGLVNGAGFVEMRLGITF